MSKIHQISGCQNASRKADVLFLHGLGGDAFGTWRNGIDESTSWPHWLGEEFSDVGVWSLGYSASPTKWMLPVGWLLSKFSPSWRNAGHTMSLPDRAGQVLDLMVQHGFGDRPILFICHSLGGLLGKQILRKAWDATDPRKRAVWENTGGVLFLATPHSGTTLASLLNSFRIVFGATVSIEDLRVHDAHLRDLYDWYRNHATLPNVQTVTYFEIRSVNNVIPIVNPTSSHPGVGADPVPLDEDHLSIAKPRDREAQVCGAARDLLKNYVLILGKKGHVESRSTTPTEQVLPSIGKRVIRELPPAAATKFFGRKTELQQLTARLKDGKNSAVIGPAGMGKTALAAKAMETVIGRTAESLANSPFPDGVVFLDLYTLRGQAESAWHTLANKLAGAEFREISPSRERATEACRGRNTLVIIEGGEEANGQDGRTRIDDFLSVLSSENRWLLLTRDSTQATPAETVRLNDELSPDEAGELFDSLTGGQVRGPVRDRVLSLLEGHPLALTWAGNLLARGDEDPDRLASEWESQGLPALNDPTRAEHTLEWLFERSVRGLDKKAREALSAAGMLARAPFSTSAIETAIGSSARDALRQLAQRGLIRLLAEQDAREFTHVLGYRFARQETDSNAELRPSLASWLHQHLAAALVDIHGKDTAVSLAELLEHARALLESDQDHRLWLPLVQFLLYEGFNRLLSLGRLDLSNAALEAVSVWLNHIPDQMAADSTWQREHSICLICQGDLAELQGNLFEAQQLFSKALAIVDWLAGSAPSTAGRQHDLSALFTRLGKLARSQGNLSEAQHLVSKGLGIMERLAGSEPTNTQWQRDLSVSFTKVGELAVAQGILSIAKEYYDKSLQIRQCLAETEPTNTQWQRDLSVILEKFGELATAQGDFTNAQEFFSKAFAIMERLAVSEPTNTEWQRDLSVILEKFGELATAQGKLPEAKKHYDNTLQIREGLAESDPTNMAWQRSLAVSFTMVGDLVRAQGNLPEAKERYENALEIRKRLAKSDLSNMAWQRDLAVSFERLGLLAVTQGKLPEAKERYESTLQIRKRLAKSDLTNMAWQRDLAISFNNLADLAKSQGNFPEADQLYSEAFQLVQQLAQTDSTNTEWQHDLSVSFIKRGEVAQFQGKLSEANCFYSEALQLAQRLTQADPTNSQWKRDLSVSFINLGDLATAQGNFPVAKRRYEQALEIRERLAVSDLTNLGWQRDLAISFERFGKLAGTQGNFPEAQRRYGEALSIRQRLAEANPGNTEWQRDLSFTYRVLGQLLIIQRRWAEALPLLEQSLCMGERLAAIDPTNATWQQDVRVSQHMVTEIREKLK